ncbi:hypothetical protein [Absidia glauca]|uniref:F-box domain-containing protein n=1 Tax=Absidia glauca TaxID=4829 RepID=A0A168PEC3_ABSGL|nr:hypothetical protein [Absidia glauca]
MAPLSSLPLEVLLCIHNQLDWTDQWRCMYVSREWYHAFLPLMVDLAVTLDKPELYWSFMETFDQQPPSYVRELTLSGLPIAFGLDTVVKNCVDLTALTLRSLDAHHPMYALHFSEDDDDDTEMGSPSTPSDAEDIGHFTITRALVSHAHSLTDLILDYPILVDVHPLFAAMPPGLHSLKLHKIYNSVDVMDLALLYDTCHRLKVLSLEGERFTASPGSSLLHADIANNDISNNDTNGSTPSSLVSLDLVFSQTDALRPIVNFISTVQPNRHHDLRHIGLSLHQPPSPMPSMNYTPQHLYDHLVHQCPSLTSLAMGKYTPDGLIEAFSRRNNSHGTVLQQLFMNKELQLSPFYFNINAITSIAANITSLTLVGTIEYGDVPSILHWLWCFGRLEHLELGCFTPFSGLASWPEMEIQHYPYNLSIRSYLRGSVLQDIRSVVTDALWHWQRSSYGYGTRICPRHSPACFRWLLRGLPSLVSLKLRKSSPIQHIKSLWLAIGLQKLVLFEAALDPAWMSIIKLLSNLEDLHLDLCSCAYPAMILDLSLALRFSRLEISHLCILGYRRYPGYGYANNLLGQVCLYSLSNIDDSYTKQVISIRRNQRYDKPCKQLLVVCQIIDTLIVDKKNLLA